MKKYAVFICLAICSSISCGSIRQLSQDEKYINAKNYIIDQKNQFLSELIPSINVNYFPSEEIPLLHVAIKHTNLEAVKLLLKHGADPNIKANDEYGTTALMECTNNNVVNIAEVLLLNNADINLTDNFGDPAINWSVYWGEVEMTSLFLQYHPRTDISSKHSPNTMSVALKEWKYEIVDILIKNGISINPIDSLGKALVEGVKEDNIELTEKIISTNKRRVDQLDESGTSIISIASKNGNLELVQLLKGNGANLNQYNPVGQTPLALASRFGHKEVVEYLLLNKADVNLTDSIFQLTPLIGAAISGNVYIGQRLIACGALLNTCDRMNNHSPLIWATLYNQYEFVKMLLSFNPDCSIMSNHGFTVMDIANDSIGNILKEYQNDTEKNE